MPHSIKQNAVVNREVGIVFICRKVLKKEEAGTEKSKYENHLLNSRCLRHADSQWLQPTVIRENCIILKFSLIMLNTSADLWFDLICLGLGNSSKTIFLLNLYMTHCLWLTRGSTRWVCTLSILWPKSKSNAKPKVFSALLQILCAFPNLLFSPSPGNPWSFYYFLYNFTELICRQHPTFDGLTHNFWIYSILKICAFNKDRILTFSWTRSLAVVGSSWAGTHH